ncbi:MAG: hypothetical protein H6613_13185 [Ignavibacteriales bacterium]|nr:hypothetical protein [Ignavibacteriales bacterium]
MKIERYLNNPILTIKDVPFRVNSIFNPGAVKFNNEYLLISRLEMPNGRSSFALATSSDGYKFTVSKNQFLFRKIIKIVLSMLNGELKMQELQK